MKKLIFLLPILVFGFSGTVIDIPNGKTVTIKNDHGVIKQFEIPGVIIPGNFKEQSKASLIDICLHKQVYTNSAGIYCEDVNIGIFQVANGYLKLNKTNTNIVYKKFQKIAKDSKSGVWSLNGHK